MRLPSKCRSKWLSLLLPAAVLVNQSNLFCLSNAGGSLIHLQMRSTVGILLDEIPAGFLREDAADYALRYKNFFWIAKAQRQIRLANYRLVFRSGYYSEPKGPLPLPSKTIWDISLEGRPHRGHVEGHDYVSVDFNFQTYILSDAGSPGAVEPALSTEGGRWSEPLILPIDPDLLLERTGYACMDEAELPPASVFEENTWYTYDQTCTVETPETSACHVTDFPKESCVRALARHVGKINTSIDFTRVPYDLTVAARYRVGKLVNPAGADLAVRLDQLADEQAVFYRYFTPSSCEIQEGTVGAPGWRRLLAFTAAVANNGTQAVHMGDPSDPNNPWVQGNDFVFSECHDHYHFTHYGIFGYGDQPGLKKAFCLEDTHRYHNDETTPLTAVHQTCLNQGIGAGWGDEYEFGISGQWVDVTGIDTSQPQPLTFLSNPDQFLCEGQTLDWTGQAVDPLNLSNIAFVPSGFTDPSGNPVLRNHCAFFDGWDADNLGSVQFQAPPAGSFVTGSCTRGETGPLRDCGFEAQLPLQSCTPGQKVSLSCESEEMPRVLRACEISAELGTGVACSYREALTNVIVDEHGGNVSFACPRVRDASGKTGGFSLYDAPLLANDENGRRVRCVAR